MSIKAIQQSCTVHARCNNRVTSWAAVSHPSSVCAVLVPRQHSTLGSPTFRRSCLVAAAPNGDKSTQVKPSAQQQPDRSRAPDTADSTPVWLQQLKQKWEDLDTPQKGYAVVVGLLTLAALPRVLTLLVLGLERILIGGLLAVEEVLLQVLFKGGALVGAVGVVGLVLAGVYLFLVPKTTK